MRNTEYIFLDIDGVLNDHSSFENKYCGIQSDKVALFNHLLEAMPIAKIVISSAWRYMIHGNQMTLKGFEYLLLTHGVNAFDRVAGCTRKDIDPSEPRIEQIREWLVANNAEDKSWIALDDMQLADDPRCYLIDGKVGLQSKDITKILGVENEAD